MPYNWKCCSFYPNNFGASALETAFFVISHRSIHMLTSDDVNVCIERSECVYRTK